MFRKHTQFFSSFARHKIEQDPRLVLSPGFAKAMELPGQIIRLAMVSGDTESMWSELHLRLYPAVLVASALLRAARVESVIGLSGPHGGLSNTAQVDIEFFEKGQEFSHFCLSFNVDLDTAEMQHVVYRDSYGSASIVFGS
jgi:hypothetical protein